MHSECQYLGHTYHEGYQGTCRNLRTPGILHGEPPSRMCCVKGGPCVQFGACPSSDGTVHITADSEACLLHTTFLSALTSDSLDSCKHPTLQVFQLRKVYPRSADELQKHHAAFSTVERHCQNHDTVELPPPFLERLKKATECLEFRILGACLMKCFNAEDLAAVDVGTSG